MIIRDQQTYTVNGCEVHIWRPEHSRKYAVQVTGPDDWSVVCLRATYELARTHGFRVAMRWEKSEYGTSRYELRADDTTS